MNKKRHGYQGFSFLEAIISVFVLTMGILAVLPLISSSLRDSIDARDNTIAVLLAQESLEMVRHFRDNNWVQNGSTFTGDCKSVSPNQPFFPSGDEDNCVANFRSSYLGCPASQAQAEDWENLELWNNSGSISFYGWDASASSPRTKFRRKMILDYDTNDKTTANELTVYSIVTWGNWSADDFFRLKVGCAGNPCLVNNCIAANKCAYISTVMHRWGE
jgi:type II secretory pathway pseudopilin PulG